MAAPPPPAARPPAGRGRGGEGPSPRDPPGDAGPPALVREALEGADRVGLHEDALVLGLDLDGRLLCDLLDDGLDVRAGHAEGRARDGALEPARGDLHPRSRTDPLP